MDWRVRNRSPGWRTSWDAVADWYDGWMGERGGEHHRLFAIPLALELLGLRPGERVLDVGSGQGVLAPHVARAESRYTGVDASERLVRLARRRHARCGRFLVGDARCLRAIPELRAAAFDAAVFLLSLQDMDELEAVLASASWALRRGGRLVAVLRHPCFRVPRQSGWGWDASRKLEYRRIDRYLSPLHVPNRVELRRGRGRTLSFHRPLADYVNGLAAAGLVLEAMKEVAVPRWDKARARFRVEGHGEIPLFLGLRASRPRPPAPPTVGPVPSPREESAPREVGHQGTGAEAPRLGLVAERDLVDERAQLRR
jgi:SAM-dependent methyltransferase